MKVEAAAIEISHPGKVLFPGDGITKAELVDYYRRTGPAMLDFVKMTGRFGAHVVVPLDRSATFDEARAFPMRNVGHYLHTHGDPWSGMSRQARSIALARGGLRRPHYVTK